MAEEGRPTFDLSSFSTFAFQVVQPVDLAAGSNMHCSASRVRDTASIAEDEASESSEGELSVDLEKYGAPDVLARLFQHVPPTVINIIKSSIDNVRTQVEADKELRRRRQEEVERDQNTREDEDLRPEEDDSAQHPDKGKGIDESPANAPESSVAASNSDETTPFYTPSEGQTPSTDAGADFEATEELTAVPTVVNTALDLAPTLRPETSSASAVPRRRDFFKTIFRRLADGDTRRQVLRKSAGALQLKAKLKKKWHGEQTTSECIACFDEFAAKDLVQLSCHMYCKPCFERLIKHCIEAESNWPPKCCVQPISNRKCIKYITGDLETLYKQKRQEYSTPAEYRYYCPIADCGVFVPLYERSKDLQYRQKKCPRGHLTCVDCRNWAHEDAVNCPNNKGMGIVQVMAVEEGWRRCHRCNTMIEHVSACRHIICRCGAEFCYVCGKPWWTCGCTERQLTRIKLHAYQAKLTRRAEEERARREAAELSGALERVARQHADAAVKHERIRAAKEAWRKRQVYQTYATYRTVVDELNVFQEHVLSGESRRGEDHLSLRSLEVVTSLLRKHDSSLNQLKAAWEAKIEHKMRELEQIWLDQIAQELETRGEDEVPSPMEWKPVHWVETTTTGDLAEAELHQSQKSGYERGKEEHLKRQNDALVRLRYVRDEELAIQHELMHTKKAAIVDSYRVQASELRVKTRSQRHWLKLVVAERSRLLDELMAVELADEIVEDDDDRWCSILVREEATEAGPSRFRAASSPLASASRHMQLRNPSLDITREPSPPSWYLQSLGSALHAA